MTTTTESDLTEAMADALARAKREIREDIQRNVVPQTIGSFSDLHDYVDANEYGGFCDDQLQPPMVSLCGHAEDCRCAGRLSLAESNQVQDLIDTWIKNGMKESE